VIASSTAPRERRHILYNLAILYGSGIVTSLLSLAPITFVPTYLDAAGMGRLSIAISFNGIFAALILLGTTTFIVREGARDHRRVAELLSNGIALRLGIAVVLLPVVVGCLYLLNYPAETQTVVMIMYGSLVVNLLSQTYAAALQALENMTWRSAASICMEIFAVTVGWLVLWQGGGLLGYVLVLVLANVVGLIIHSSYFVLVMPIKPVFSRQGMLQVLHGGIPFFLWAFLQTIYAQTSSLMLSKLGSEEAVGWFATAYQFIIPLFLLPNVVITVLLPQFSQLYISGQEPFRRALSRAMSYMTLLTIPLAFGLFAIADRVIDLFNYPATFQQSIPVLRVLAFMLPGTSLLMVAATAVAAMNKERAWARISLFSLLTAVVCNAILIPLAHSSFANPAIGAAAAALLVELLTFAWSFRLLGAAFFDRQVFTTLGKTVLVGSGMAGLVVALPQVPLPIVIVLGVTCYVGGVLLLRVIPAEDLELAWGIGRRRWHAVISMVRPQSTPTK
jgi:O-antigen/teichoic acid export membrane protein